VTALGVSVRPLGVDTGIDCVRRQPPKRDDRFHKSAVAKRLLPDIAVAWTTWLKEDDKLGWITAKEQPGRSGQAFGFRLHLLHGFGLRSETHSARLPANEAALVD
jgi:hypothetical protein